MHTFITSILCYVHNHLSKSAANWREKCARSSWGIRTYRLKESFAHLPSVCTVLSLMPLAIAVVAAPMRKECPEYREQSILASCSAARTFSTKICRDSGRPSLSLNNGPSSWPLKARYARIAATGQISFCVLPIYISSPILVWSVLEPFR